MRILHIFLINALFSILFYHNSFSQGLYEKGYIISIQGDFQECYILNEGWYNNPNTINYKIEKEGNVLEGNLNTIKEFGIGDKIKYIKATVDIDLSSDNEKKLDFNRAPKFEMQNIFLKVLVEGKVSLFQYKNSKLIKFFYSTEDSAIEQLVYKRYLRNNFIMKNDYYKQQINNAFSNQSFENYDLNNLEYKAKDIMDIFIQYNDSENLKTYSLNTYKPLFYIRLVAGTNFADLTVKRITVPIMDIDFNSRNTFTAGLNFEMVFPYFKHKLALSVQPIYHHYKDTISVTYGEKAYANVKALFIPIGITYKSYLSPKLTLSINNSVVASLIKSNIKEEYWTDSYTDYKNHKNYNFSFSLGIEYQNFINLSITKYLPINLHPLSPAYNSNYNSFMVTIGVKLIGTKRD